METDAVLMEWSVHGRPDAFVEVVRRHEVAVHAFLARRAGRETADDLLAEVWLRAFASAATYDASCEDARPWLYGIARNVLRAHWRSGPFAGQPADAVTDPWDEVIDRLDSTVQARALIAAVRALPAQEREVLLLVAWEQLNPAEAAAVLGIPQGTARSRLHRARTSLRLELARQRTRSGEDRWLKK